MRLFGDTMKAQSYFGGTDPKDKATKVHQKGLSGSSSGGGLNMVRKTKVKQVGVKRGTGGNTHQMVRDSQFQTRSAGSRPSLPGKEDNRTAWK